MTCLSLFDFLTPNDVITDSGGRVGRDLFKIVGVAEGEEVLVLRPSPRDQAGAGKDLSSL